MKVFSKTFIAGAIALVVGFGSVFSYKGIIKAMNPATVEEEATQTNSKKISHQRMLLENLMNMGTFEVDGGIDFTLEDSTAIKLGVDFVGDISNINNIKLQGDANLYLNGIDLSTNISYFKDADSTDENDKGTIYFSYKENNFYLETAHILDFIDMLPTEYGIELNLPDELKNLDLNTINEKIEGMEEKESTNGDIYFVLNLNDELNLYVKSDSEYNVKGIRTDTFIYKGNEIKLDLTLNKVEDVTLEAPNKANYQNFKPVFNIFKSFYNVFNKKQNSINISANIEKFDDEKEEYNALLDASLDFGYDVNAKSFQIDADIHENERHHKVGMLFEDKTAYLDLRATKLSIKFDSVGDTIAYIMSQIDFDLTDKLLSSTTELLNSDKFTNLRSGLNNLVGAISISDNSFSIALNTDEIGLDMGIITPVLRFNENGFESISVHDLKIKGLKIDVDLSLNEYVRKNIVKENYVEFEPALTIVEAVLPLLKETQFRLEFDALVDSKEAGVNDITIDGGLQFDVSDHGFGYGKAVIVDRNSYRHEIKADMKTKDEFLFSYNDTLNGKFTSKTLKELYSLVEDIIKNPDEHFIELFGELIESMKNTPIGKVLDGDYGALLESQLINSLSISDTSMKLNVSLAIIGMDDKSVDVEIKYHRDSESDKAYLDGLSLTNLELGDNVITFNAYLKQFDPNKENERLDAYEDYLDFSDIKVLLQLGVNTSKFEYFHFSASLNFNLKLIVDINRTMDLDIKIRNNKGKVQVAIEIENVPIIDLKVINFNGNSDYIGTDGRNVSLYYDEDTFYIKRVDKVHTFLSIHKYYVTYAATYTQEYFLENIATILLQDCLGVQDKWMDDILGDSNTSSTSSQIEYEKILKDFRFDANAGKFTFKIDLFALTHVSVLDTLDLIVYEDKATEQLTTVDVNLTIHVLLNIKIALHLETVDKQTTLSDANRLTKLESWVASREGAQVNSFKQISRTEI